MLLLIRNLNKFTTISEVVALFLPFGLVTGGRIMNSKSGFSDGTAMVEIDHKGGLVAISELNDMRFMNSYIRVEESIAKNVHA